MDSEERERWHVNSIKGRYEVIMGLKSIVGTAQSIRGPTTRFEQRPTFSIWYRAGVYTPTREMPRAHRDVSGAQVAPEQQKYVHFATSNVKMLA